MRARAMLLIGLVGCGFSAPNPATDGDVIQPDSDDGDLPIDGSGIDGDPLVIDGAIDASPDAAQCFGSGTTMVCVNAPPTGTLTFAATDEINTDSDPRCQVVTVAGTPSCVVAAATIVVPGTSRVHGSGSRPLVLLASGSFTVEGTVSVSSVVMPPGSAANRACPALTAGGADSGGAGGGAGGSFQGRGGGGGTGDANNSGGPPGGGPGAGAAEAMPGTALRGGCNGSNGGAGNAGGGGGGGTTPGGAAGLGGGAVALVAGGSIAVPGKVYAVGGFGLGGDNNSGGGGGGSGGMIVLDGTAVNVSGRLLASGGGGGEGGGFGSGNPGAAVDEDGSRGAGGSGGDNDGGDGGQGSGPGGTALEGTSGNGDDGGGGGGGGAAGYILVRNATIAGTAIVSPSVTQL